MAVLFCQSVIEVSSGDRYGGKCGGSSGDRLLPGQEAGPVRGGHPGRLQEVPPETSWWPDVQAGLCQPLSPGRGRFWGACHHHHIHHHHHHHHHIIIIITIIIIIIIIIITLIIIIIIIKSLNHHHNHHRCPEVEGDSEEHAESLFNVFDLDGNGSMDFMEFMQADNGITLRSISPEAFSLSLLGGQCCCCRRAGKRPGLLLEP